MSGRGIRGGVLLAATTCNGLRRPAAVWTWRLARRGAAAARPARPRATGGRREPPDCRKYAGVGRAARDAVCVAALPGVPVRGRNRHAPARGCACRRRSRWYDARRSHCDIRRRQHPGWSCDVRRHGGRLSRVAAAVMHNRREMRAVQSPGGACRLRKPGASGVRGRPPRPLTPSLPPPRPSPSNAYRIQNGCFVHLSSKLMFCKFGPR